MERLNYEFISKGQIKGLSCCDEEGNFVQALKYQETFVNFFMEVQQGRPNVIPEYVNVGEGYGIGG